MVLVMYESNVDGQRAWEKMECMVFHSDYKHLSQMLLLAVYITTLGLGDKESVIVNSVIPVHASGRQGEIKIVCLHLNKYIF